MVPDPGFFLFGLRDAADLIGRKNTGQSPTLVEFPPARAVETTGAGEVSSTVALSGTYTLQDDRDHGTCAARRLIRT